MRISSYFFFLNDPAPPEIYTLSLHDALPIYARWTQRRRKIDAPAVPHGPARADDRIGTAGRPRARSARAGRSEEHTSELQSQFHLVCRLLLEKKKKIELNTSLSAIDKKYKRI